MIKKRHAGQSPGSRKNVTRVRRRSEGASRQLRCVSTLTGARLRERGNREPRQVDDKDASVTRHVARIDPAIVGFSAPSAEGEAKTQAIRASLLERPE